jgi:hypothetical protein
MPERLQIVPLQQATGQGKFISEYVRYIEEVPAGEAGLLYLSPGESSAVVRRRLTQAAQTLGVPLRTKRASEGVYFWVGSPTATDESPRRPRGRPRRDQPARDEAEEVEETLELRAAIDEDDAP